MEFNNNADDGFTVIEPDIYKKLNWDNDLIILYLIYMQTEIPNILKIESDKIEIFIVSIENFLGQNYPAIGIRNKPNLKESITLDFFDIDEKIDNWLKNIGGIENLKQKIDTIQSVDWETLKRLKKYPKYL